MKRSFMIGEKKQYMILGFLKIPVFKDSFKNVTTTFWKNQILKIDYA